MRYALNRWPAFALFLDDGRITIDNNAAERAMRPIALGRKNYLFAGSDVGGDNIADAMTLIETAKMSGLDPPSLSRGCPRAHQRSSRYTASMSFFPGTGRHSFDAKKAQPLEVLRSRPSSAAYEATVELIAEDGHVIARGSDQSASTAR